MRVEPYRAQFFHAVVDNRWSEVVAQLASFFDREGLVRLLGEHDEVESLGSCADRQPLEIPMYRQLILAVELEWHYEWLSVVLDDWHKKATVLSSC